MATRQYYHAEQGSEVTQTSNSTWVDAVTLTATLDASSDYVLFWGGQFANQSVATSDFRLRVIDTVTSTILHDNNQEPRSTSDYVQSGGIAFLTAGGGGRSVTIKIQVQAETNGDSIKARGGKLTLLKLDASRDFWAESLAEQGPIDGGTWTDAVTKTFTPTGANYLFIGSCTLTSTATSAGGYGRLSLDGGSSTPGYGAPPNDLNSWVSSGYLMHATGLSGSKTIRLQFNDHGGATTASIRYARVLALDLGGFEDSHVSTSGSASSGGETTFTTAHSLTFTAADSDYLLLGNWYQGANTTLQEHQAQLDDGSQVSIHERTVINVGAGREIISFVPAVRSYSSGSKTVVIQRRITYSGYTSRITEGAVIAALQLEASAGGSTTYNESLTESTAPAQSATTAATFQSAASESVTSAASQAVGLSAPVTLSESATVSDDTAAALVHEPALSESVTASEASANAATFAPTLTESATATESSATAATFASSASESVTSADSAASAAAFLSSVSETIAANDNGAPAASIPANLDEAIAPYDAASSSQTAQASLSETTSADASAEPATTIGASLEESIEAGEESTASVEGGAVTYDETLSEAVGLADDASASATLTAARSEAVSSSVTQSASAILAAVRSEAVTVADVAQGAAIIGASVSEDAGVSVAQSVAAIFTHALAEPVAANDDEVVALAIDDALSEDVGAGDVYDVEGGEAPTPSIARMAVDPYEARIAETGGDQRIAVDAPQSRTATDARHSRTAIVETKRRIAS